MRYWLVLRALDRHRAGDYVPVARHLDAVFDQMIDGIRAGRIVLEFRPERLVAFYLPARHDPLYLQALVYWCAQMQCSLELMDEARGLLGHHAALKRLIAVVSRLQRDRQQSRLWRSTFFKDARSSPTVPMQLA